DGLVDEHFIDARALLAFAQADDLRSTCHWPIPLRSLRPRSCPLAPLAVRCALGKCDCRARGSAHSIRQSSREFQGGARSGPVGVHRPATPASTAPMAATPVGRQNCLVRQSARFALRRSPALNAPYTARSVPAL